jgi:hypothetical protein
MSASEPLSAARLAELSELLGDRVIASSSLVAALVETVVDRRAHEHNRGEDLFCGNLAGWSGERVGPLLRRLFNAEAEVARLTARVAELEPPAGLCGNESPFGRLCDLPAGHIGDHQRTEGTSVRSWIRSPRAGAK